jgi:hypothetical protein
VKTLKLSKLPLFVAHLVAQLPREAVWRDRMSAYNTMLALYRAGYDEEGADAVSRGLVRNGNTALLVGCVAAVPLATLVVAPFAMMFFASGFAWLLSIILGAAAVWHLGEVAKDAVALPEVPPGHPEESYTQVWPKDFTMHLASLTADKIRAAKAARERAAAAPKANNGGGNG